MEHVTKNSKTINHSSNLFHVACYVLRGNNQLSMLRLTQHKIVNSKKLKGFTLLELLLVISIVAVLAGIVMIGLRPAERINSANDAKAVANVKDLEKALKAYTLDNAGNVPAGFSNITQSGIYDICKLGETTGCVNLDSLITSKHLGNIPIDTRNTTTFTTGYKVDYNATSKNVAIYTKETYDQRVKYCPPGDPSTCLSPVGEWLFNEGTGLTAIDTSGNGNNGTLTNGPSWVDGKSGKALSFDGVDDYAVIPDSSSLTSTTNLTISSWFKTSSLTAQTIFAKASLGDEDEEYVVIIVNNNVYFDVGGNSGPYIQTGYTVSDNKWHYISTTHSRIGGVSTLKLYIDGKDIGGTTNGSTVSPNDNLYNVFIGKRTTVYSQGFSGLIDQVRIYNYSRTPAQIAWEYNQGLPIVQWKFDETSGTTASDSSGNGNDGTLVGGPVWIAGKYGNALSFDSVDDYVIKNSFSSFPTNNISTTVWVKTTDSNNAVISYASTATDNDWLIFNTANLELYRASWLTTGVFANDNNWTHLAVTRNGTTGMTKLYKNGALVSSGVVAAGTLITNNGALVVGQEQDSVGGTFDINQAYGGLIDDVRIYNYELTQSQVMQVMQGN